MQQRWFLISLLLHALALLLCWFGLPHLMPPIIMPDEVIPVDVVNIADITNARVADKKPEPPKPTPPKAEPPKPEPPKPQPPAPAPPTPTPPTPEPPKAEPRPQPPKPQPAPQENAEALPDLLKKLQPKPKPQKDTTEQRQQDMMASLLKNVAKLKPDDQPDKAHPRDEASPPQTPPAPALSDKLTISQIDAVKRQIAGCWNVPIGARDAQNTTIEIHIEVNPDRTLRSAEIVDKMRLQTDPFFRAMAESAMRALENPHCSPLLLPPDQYNTWHSITFNFDPKAMLE